MDTVNRMQRKIIEELRDTARLSPIPEIRVQALEMLRRFLEGKLPVGLNDHKKPEAT